MCAQEYGGRWRIEEQLNEGGQSHTFKVNDISGEYDQPCVLKRLKNVKRLDRFKTEVDTVRDINHSNVIRPIDYQLDPSNEKPYLVVPYYKKGSIADILQSLTLTPTDALDLFIKICEGVCAIHIASVVHRDLKPENILLGENKNPVVTDFGLCYVEHGKRHTLTEEAVGSRLYMAPELEDGREEEISPASDVYSLGKVLYWLISGGKMFSREKHRDEDYDLVNQTENPQMEHINRFLDNMITESPSDRLQDACDVSSKVQEYHQLLYWNYNVVSSDLPQRCTYCGLGTYQRLAGTKNRNMMVHFFGTNVQTQGDWHIVACDQCGHLQFFRLDKAQRRDDWWGM